jgi:hypothetical protein
MTGRVLQILKDHAEWSTISDIHLLYQSLLNMGFDPDEMDYRELAQTCHNLRPYKLFGKTAGYAWDIFLRLGEDNETTETNEARI